MDSHPSERQSTAVRASYNGITLASQARDEGSIPFARSISSRCPHNDSGPQRTTKRLIVQVQQGIDQTLAKNLLEHIE